MNRVDDVYVAVCQGESCLCLVECVCLCVALLVSIQGGSFDRMKLFCIGFIYSEMSNLYSLELYCRHVYVLVCVCISFMNPLFTGHLVKQGSVRTSTVGPALFLYLQKQTAGVGVMLGVCVCVRVCVCVCVCVCVTNSGNYDVSVIEQEMDLREKRR